MQWTNKRRLGWYLADRVPGLPLDTLTAAIAQSWAAWQRVCGLVFRQVASSADADLIVLARKIDGVNGTLAEHELPPGNDQQLRGWIDNSERWAVESPPPAGRIDLVAVYTHEAGHAIGLSHTNTPGSLLNPYYDPKIRTPQKWDIQEAVNRYGGPVEEPKPVDPGPAGVPDSFPGILEVFGAVYSVECKRKL